MVFASDFSEEVKNPFKNLLKFTSHFETKLYLVLINTPNSFKTSKESTQLMNEFTNHFNLTNYTIQVYNNINIEKRGYQFC